MKKILILIIAFCLSACGVKSASNDKVEKYGEKVSYADGREMKFPDFSIKFTGKRGTGNAPIKMTFYDFLVTKGENKQTVSWSSGTGDIAPAIFNVAGTDFVLELSVSDVIKGQLGEGNLVIWKKADFEKAKEDK